MSPLAAAAGTSGGGGSSLLLLLLPLLLLGYLFWSQRRRQRKVAQVQQSLQVGDEVMTSAGLYGRITELEPQTVHLEIATGVVARFDRRAVIGPQAPTDPAPSAEGER